VNGQEPERQTVPEKEQQNPAKTVETAETVQEQDHTSKTANCTFSGELVPIDLKRFTRPVPSAWWNVLDFRKNAFPLPGVRAFFGSKRTPERRAADASDRETLVGHRNNRLERGGRRKEKRQAEIQPLCVISCNHPHHETFSLFSKRGMDCQKCQSIPLFSVSAPVFPAALRS
jgi:hypothetical protein